MEDNKSLWSVKVGEASFDDLPERSAEQIREGFLVEQLLEIPSAIKELGDYYEGMELTDKTMSFLKQRKWTLKDQQLGLTITTTTSREDRFTIPTPRMLDVAYSRWRIGKEAKAYPLWAVVAAGALVLFLGLMLGFSGDELLAPIGIICVFIGIGVAGYAAVAYSGAKQKAETETRDYPQFRNRILLGYKCGLSGRHQLLSITSKQDMADLHSALKELICGKCLNETYHFG